MSICLRELDELAHRLAELGPEAVERELAELADAAACEGVDPVLTSVIRDRHEPSVVRQRAFAKVNAQRRRRLDVVADQALPGQPPPLDRVPA